MNDRFNFRVWDRYTHETPAEQMQFLCFDGCLVDSDGCHHSPDDYVIEQCTGLKDKNGKLIYENDIVLGGTGFKYCIIWSEMELGWALQNLETKLCIAMNAFTPDEIEIIGNIHEQAEQKEE